jgi:hypothetical protein
MVFASGIQSSLPQHQGDAAILSAWAKHFRGKYCRDDQIECAAGLAALRAH